MSLEAIAKEMPILTALVFFFAAVLQVWSGRDRNWTETFYITGCISIGMYAFFDRLFLLAGSADEAIMLARLSYSLLVLGLSLLLLCTFVLMREMRGRHALLMVPTAIVISAIWGPLVQGAEPSSWGWRLAFRGDVYAACVGYVAFCLMGGLVHLLRLYAKTRTTSKATAFRFLFIAVAFMSTFVLGIMANVLLTASGWGETPLFPTLMVFPGLVMLLATTQTAWEKVAVAFRNKGGKRYEVKAACLCSDDGEFIASRVADPADSTSMGILRTVLGDGGGIMMIASPASADVRWVAADICDSRVAILRGDHLAVALLLVGRESWMLMATMREVLQRMEARESHDRAGLSAAGEEGAAVEHALDALFIKPELF